jgi:hypothetical protein
MGDETPNPESQIPAPRAKRAWEDAVERQIREAQERGDFDHLPGEGKPLPSGSWGDGDWALAFHVLKQAGETLPWIAVGNEIQAAEERLSMLIRDAQRLSAAERARARERYLREAAALDKLLQEYAFLVPSRRLERGRLPPHIAAKQFDEAVIRRAS